MGTMLRITLLLMTGVSFSLGFVVGLLIHLPGVSTPVDGRSRQTRHASVQDRIAATNRSIQAVKSQVHLHKSSVHLAKSPDLLDGVYWSREAEKLLPGGGQSQDSWRAAVADQTVIAMQQGCGRMQNRLLTLSSGVQACARYRFNTDQMQGELYSYYLARLLDIENVPVTVLAVPDPSLPAWRSVAGQIQAAQWSPSRVVALTPWLHDLQPAYMPRQLQAYLARELRPGQKSQGPSPGLVPSPDLGRNLSQADLEQLLQWSDLIILDYLTANVDRVVNNMYNLQWNSDMLASPVHNLERQAGKLVFLDNESGLFHSYRLLDRYGSYQQLLLQGLCVFRRRTSQAIRQLQGKDAGQQLQQLLQHHEPLHHLIPAMNQKTANTLQRRIDDVYHRIVQCESQHAVL